MKRYLLLASLFMAGIAPMMAEIEDDIYFDPKKAAHKSNQAKTYDNSSSRRSSNYIANFQDMDVDEYNMRGQYYMTPIDTIGERTENEPDFVYTTQIQKYYNPTIVVDNERVLSDVLNNSYGNVSIEYNYNGIPSFGTWFGNSLFNVSIGYPYYSWNPYYPWNSYYGPSYYWNWGWTPSWYWNTSWAWGPSWSWGGYYPPYRPYNPPVRPPYNNYRPGSNKPVGPAPGWSNGSHRPLGNYNGNNHSTRPGNRPTTPSGSMNNYSAPGYGRYHNSTNVRPGTSTTPSSTGNLHNQGTGNPRPGYTIGEGGHRRPNTGNTYQSGRPTNNSSTGNNRVNGSSTNSSRPGSGYNHNNSSQNYSPSDNRSNSSGSYGGSSSRSSNRSYNSGSYGGNRSYGGSYGGGRSSGGSRPGGNGGGGRHR